MGKPGPRHPARAGQRKKRFSLYIAGRKETLNCSSVIAITCCACSRASGMVCGRCIRVPVPRGAEGEGSTRLRGWMQNPCVGGMPSAKGSMR